GRAVGRADAAPLNAAAVGATARAAVTAVDASAVVADAARLTRHARAQVRDAFSARAELVGGAGDARARVRRQAGEVACHPRAAGGVARRDRDALAVCRTAGLPGGAADAVARLREATGGARPVDAGLSGRTAHARASVDDRDAARVAGGAGPAGHGCAGHAG